MPEDSWCRPAVPGDSGQDPRALVYDQLSLATCVCVLSHAGSTSCPRGLGPWSEGPWGRPAVLGDSSQGPRACGFEDLTWVTRALIPGLTGSTSYHRVIKMSQVFLPGSEVLRGRPALLGHMRLRPRARRVDKLSRSTGASVRMHSGLTSSPG